MQKHLRVILGGGAILAMVVSCGPGYDGAWAPVNVESVIAVDGTAYATGTFEPKLKERGDAALVAIDVERLLNSTDLIAPTRDLSKAVVREWNSGKARVEVYGASRLWSVRQGNEPIPNQPGKFTAAGISVWDVKEPLARPRLDKELDVPNGEGYSVEATIPFGEGMMMLKLLRVDNQPPIHRLVAVSFSSGTFTELVATLEDCQERLADVERGLLHCVVPAHGDGTPARIDTYRVSQSPVTLERVGGGDTPEFTQFTDAALGVDGTVFVTQPGAKGTGASVVAYRVGEMTPARVSSWQVADTIVLSALRTTKDGRWLAQSMGSAVLLELPAGGGNATVVSTLTELAAFAFVPMQGSPAALRERFLTPLGRQGLAVVEVEGAKLTVAGGFVHTWRDSFPYTVQTGLYTRR